MAKERDTGTRDFDGRLIIKVGRKYYKLLNDPTCAMLMDADPSRKVVLLTRDGLIMCEVQIGYIQHQANPLFLRRGWDAMKREMFGIKFTHARSTSTLIRYEDVIGWCYQDECYER